MESFRETHLTGDSKSGLVAVMLGHNEHNIHILKHQLSTTPYFNDIIDLSVADETDCLS